VSKNSRSGRKECLSRKVYFFFAQALSDIRKKEKAMKKTFITLTIVLAIVLTMVGSVLADDQGKVYVCKYVGDPGSEVLQTGQNPIEVSINAIKDYAGVGSWFNDEQGPSYVLGVVPMDPEPTAADCPSTPPPSECSSVGEWTFVSETDWVYDDVNHTRTKVQTFVKYDLNDPFGVCDTKTEPVTETATVYCINDANVWIWPDNPDHPENPGVCLPTPPPPPPGPTTTPIPPPITGGEGGPP
jgi:hypothetical protein